MVDLPSPTAEPAIDAALLDDAPSVLAEMWNRVIAVADRVDEPEWSAPTPCAEWDVGALLAHCAATQLALDGTGLPEPPGAPHRPEGSNPDDRRRALDDWTAAGVAAYEGADPDVVRTDLRRARDGHVVHLMGVTDWEAEARGPLGPTTEAGLLRTRCFDLWVHLEDLRLALDEELDVGDATPAARAAHRYVLDRVPWMSVKRAGFEEGATVRITVRPPVGRSSVLAVVDGRAAWDDAAESSGGAVDADPLGLTMLACGRDDEATWHERGLLEWSGPQGEAFVRHARMF